MNNQGQNVNYLNTVYCIVKYCIQDTYKALKLKIEANSNTFLGHDLVTLMVDFESTEILKLLKYSRI